MPSVTVKLPATINRKLRTAARRRGVSLSAVTRRALERELTVPEPDFATLAKPYLGMFHGPRDLSTRERNWDEEIRARVKAVDAGQTTGIPCEVVKKEMAARFG